MKTVVIWTVAGAVIGLIGGLGLGVAGYGTAVSGVYVFGPIGAIVGFLGGRQSLRA
jgi:hypothetical protein